jgi:hypothetical protein
LDHLWIIAKFSSATLYYRNYTRNKIDPDLVSGLLSAFNNFSEVELNGLGIESITMGGLQWVYFNDATLGMLVVTAGHSRGSADLVRARLEIILKMFVTQYNITPEKMQKTTQFIADFYSFNTNLDSLQEQWVQAESVSNAGELFDMLGVFQQVLDLFLVIIQNECDKVRTDAVMADLKAFARSFEALFDVAQHPEFQKINFDEQRGWTVITLDPTKLSKAVLNKGFFAIIGHVRAVMEKHLGPVRVLQAISQDMLPYLFTNWELLEMLDLVKPLVITLLERTSIPASKSPHS